MNGRLYQAYLSFRTKSSPPTGATGPAQARKNMSVRCSPYRQGQLLLPWRTLILMSWYFQSDNLPGQPRAFQARGLPGWVCWRCSFSDRACHRPSNEKPKHRCRRWAHFAHPARPSHKYGKPGRKGRRRLQACGTQKNIGLPIRGQLF